MVSGVTCDQKVDTLSPHPRTRNRQPGRHIWLPWYSYLSGDLHGWSIFNLIYTISYTFLLHAQNANLDNDKATKIFNAGSLFLFLDGTQDVCWGSLQEIPDWHCPSKQTISVYWRWAECSSSCPLDVVRVLWLVSDRRADATVAGTRSTQS